MFDFFIHSAVSHFGRESPQRAALVCNGDSLSYAELDAASNRLANALMANACRPGDRVGIFMHKSLELGVAIYGVLKAGAVFVPLDPFMPAERLRFIVDDCDIRHVVSADAMRDRLAALQDTAAAWIYGVGSADGLNARNLNILDWQAIATQPDSAPDVRIVDQDIAYIMYTSGSTGSPKGMMHSHHGSLSYARWGAQHVGLTATDRVASHAPLHFDLSIFDFFSTSQAGATVVLVPEPVTKFAASWTAYIDAQQISVVFTVPFTLLDMLERGALDERDLGSLRWILFGGEPLAASSLHALMTKLPGVRFTNVYGPAEAPSCTCYDVPPLPAEPEDPLPIGTASRNSADLIVDESDRECPTGEIGELCIRSSTLMRGYWNRPDLNERAYLYRDGHGPFADVYYRTGDLVVRHADGLLRFLGRRDRMVKTRGHRVELDEVEACLNRHDDVAEAAVFDVPDGKGSRAIRAAVMLRHDGQADAAELSRHLRRLLPGYAVPERIFLIDCLPRTSSGKIDRRAVAGQLAGSDAESAAGLMT